MAGIYTTSVNEQTIDEAPMAYKSLDDIIDVIRDSVDIVDITPIQSIRTFTIFLAPTMQRIIVEHALQGITSVLTPWQQ